MTADRDRELEGSLERWEELACDAALTGLDEAERAELAALDTPNGERELRALECTAGEVAAIALEEGDRAEPMPAALEARVLAALEAPAARGPEAPSSQRLRREPPPAPRATRTSTARASWAPWAVAAAAAVLAVSGWSRRTPNVADVADAASPRAHDRAGLLALPGTTTLPWTPTTDPAARGATGDVVWHGGLQHGVMTFRGLAANDAATFQYQLWIFDAERDEAFPVDGGVFDVGAAGEAVVPIAAKLRVGKAKLFAVTVEKPGGVVVSKRERVVLTAAPRG